MTPRPTYDDANLVLRLYELRREERMRKARAWFAAKCKVKTYDELLALAPAGSDDNASFRMVVTYWELAGSFITSGILNKELFFQSGRELLMVHERLRHALPSIRAAYQDPHYLQHLEAVGNDFAAYLQSTDGDAYAAFVKRIS